MKKRLSVLLASAFTAILALVMAVPAYAATGKNTITINSKTSGHTFEAYQIFAGDYAEVDDVATLSNVKWGDGVTDGDALLTALKDDATIGSYFVDDATAADVAETLATATVADSQTKAFEDNAANIDAFANVVSEFLSATHTDSDDPTGTAPNLTYTISNVADGYYFVKDKDNSLDGSEANAYTKFMLQVVHSVTVDAKADVPTIDKTTGEPNQTTTIDLTGNNASIGDAVPFKITSKVPNMDGYNNYFFIVHDTLSEGLSFNADSLVVKVGEKTLARDASADGSGVGDYYVKDSTTDAGETELQIVFKNFVNYTAGQNVEITYTATVTKDAVIGINGNLNEAYLEYSNNPNVDSDGDYPDDDDVTGETPKVTTKTFVTGIELYKVDETGKSLEGAQFTISGEKINQVLMTGNVFTQSENGTYYKLKDGSYTTTEPNAQTEDEYESTTIKYVMEEKTELVTSTEHVVSTAQVGSDGKLVFDGLAAGDYVITEVKSPDGYNLLEEPIEVTIECTISEPVSEDSTCTWTAKDTTTNDGITVENGVVKITVQNERGSLLPSTGGMGTTMFYVVGGVLVAGAAVAYVVKRRMDANNA